MNFIRKHRSHSHSLKVLLFVVFSLIASQHSIAQETSCEDLLHFQTVAELSHASYYGDDLSNPNVIANSLYTNSETFRKFYQKQTQLSELDPSKVSVKMIADYHREFFIKFEDPSSLEKLQSDSLKRALLAHGASIDPLLSGQENLAKQSRENVVRLLGDYPNKNIEFADHPEILSALDSVELRFHRNSHYDDVYGDFILSSKQLTDYTGRMGYQSTYDFNSKKLKSDDNIFFHAQWMNKKQQIIASDNMYGKHASEINNQSYAQKNGWISYFVMWPMELNPLRNVFNLRHQTQIIKQLHQLDFTPADFDLLVQTLLGRRLLSLKTSADIKLQNRWACLTKWYREERLLAYLKAEILVPLHLDVMEFKIPVALPQDQVSQIPSYD